MIDEEAYWNRYRLAQTLTAISALWAVIALLTCAGGWRESAAARAAAGWPPVEGRVTAVEVVRVEQGGRVPFTIPAVQIAYAYSIGGRTYHNDRLRADGDPVDPASSAGQRWLALAPGDSVNVYVNSEDPHQAALDRSATGRWLPNGLTLLGLAALAGLLAWWLRRVNGRL